MWVPSASPKDSGMRRGGRGRGRGRSVVREGKRVRDVVVKRKGRVWMERMVGLWEVMRMVKRLLSLLPLLPLLLLGEGTRDSSLCRVTVNVLA
jgi:hypothetical protein